MIHSANPTNRIYWMALLLSLLTATPLLSLLFTPTVQLLPLLWAAYSAPVGALMVLSAWVGLGHQHWIWRLLFGLAGSAFAATWPFVTGIIQLARMQGGDSHVWLVQYATLAIPYTVVVFLFGSMFMITRRQWKIETHVDGNAIRPGRGLHFSVLNLLVLTSLVAVVLALMQASRGKDGADHGAAQTWQIVAANVLGFGAYFVNTACAVHATLRPGPFLRNISLVLLVSTLLGFAISFAARQDLSGWRLVVGGTLISIIPTVVVTLSLLIVRSGGYRMVRR